MTNPGNAERGVPELTDDVLRSLLREHRGMVEEQFPEQYRAFAEAVWRIQAAELERLERESDGLTCSHPEVHAQTLWKENERLRQENAALRTSRGYVAAENRRLRRSLEHIRAAAMAGLTGAREHPAQAERPREE